MLFYEYSCCTHAMFYGIFLVILVVCFMCFLLYSFYAFSHCYMVFAWYSHFFLICFSYFIFFSPYIYDPWYIFGLEYYCCEVEYFLIRLKYFIWNTNIYVVHCRIIKYFIYVTQASIWCIGRVMSWLNHWSCRQLTLIFACSENSAAAWGCLLFSFLEIAEQAVCEGWWEGKSEGSEKRTRAQQKK